MPDRPQLNKLVECGFPREVMQYEPDQPIDEVHDFAQNGQPPVAIWTGSYLIDGIERFILHAVEACHDRGLRAMVFHRNPEDVVDQLPENVGVFDLLAPADAFEHCSAVIAVPALDGFATVMGAGLPAIWIGANHGTRIAAMHAEEAGGCIHLKIEEANHETLSKGLEDIFSQDCVDEAISNALIIQAEDGLTVAADAIERFVEESAAL